VAAGGQVPVTLQHEVQARERVQANVPPPPLPPAAAGLQAAGPG
jgi:hypothetical protein